MKAGRKTGTEVPDEGMGLAAELVGLVRVELQRPRVRTTCAGFLVQPRPDRTSPSSPSTLSRARPGEALVARRLAHLVELVGVACSLRPCIVSCIRARLPALPRTPRRDRPSAPRWLRQRPALRRDRRRLRRRTCTRAASAATGRRKNQSGSGCNKQPHLMFPLVDGDDQLTPAFCVSIHRRTFASSTGSGSAPPPDRTVSWKLADGRTCRPAPP